MKALSFNGTDQYATQNDATAYAFNTITFEAWIKPTTTDGFRCIFIKEQAYGLGFNGGSLMLQCWNPISATMSFSPVINNWQHIAMVFNSGVSGSAIYLNGVKSTWDISGSVVNQSSANAKIGYASGMSKFTGKMTYVRIWNVCRTSQEIADNYNKHITNHTNLVGLYTMNEGTGTSLSNTSTYYQTNPFVLQGTTTYTWDSVDVPNILF
jgi:hypothetical protein